MLDFRKILIANRGEIACRIIRSCRELGIISLAVYSDADADAMHVREADEAIHIGAAPSRDSYLDGQKLAFLAAASGAQAVHPGYGFLAENADFARACQGLGLVFIGPSPESIDAMGNKARARDIVSAAGVPVIPGAPLDESQPLEAQAAELGFPLMVKAAMGGGGKGMRVVREPEALADAVFSVKNEARAAFGDDQVILERYIERPRHVEVQIFGDSSGRVVALYERECSVQRRHQKIIEEAPSPALDAALRERFCEAAVAAGKALDYCNAGTVEFLLGADREFYFLEVNTRIQVEHPVTEMITGLDLVRLQIEVARGGLLPDVLPEIKGHAIECRLYAEDPSHDFLPCPGKLAVFEPPAGIRVDSGVQSGDTVTVHYDPLLAKLIAWGATREAAIARLERALAETVLCGIASNLDFLAGVLAHPAFREGRLSTHFLSEHAIAGRLNFEADTHAGLLLASAAFVLETESAACRRDFPGIPSGWRNVPNPMQSLSFELESQQESLELSYRLRPGGLRCELGGRAYQVGVRYSDGGRVRLQVDGKSRAYRVWQEGADLAVQGPEGRLRLKLRPRFIVPGAEDDGEAATRAPLNGTVTHVLVAVGDTVEAGQRLILIEAMKMEHALCAHGPALVEAVLCEPGMAVAAGQELIRLQEVALAEEA